MIQLFDTERTEDTRSSSKGNQLKWRREDTWYKADYCGYEGYAEYAVSRLLAEYSNLPGELVVDYQTEQIAYRNTVLTGCASRNFLKAGERLITLERLFQIHYARSFYVTLYEREDVKERTAFLAEQTEQMTGLHDFGRYLSLLLTVDALFLNDDRHLHNIAVIETGNHRFRYCPIFDNGAALLSDTTIDYPMSYDVYDLIDSAKARTVSPSFDDQLEAAEELYGQHLRLNYDSEAIDRIAEEENCYPAEVKARAATVVRETRRRYPYLFSAE